MVAEIGTRSDHCALVPQDASRGSAIDATADARAMAKLRWAHIVQEWRFGDMKQHPD